MTSCINLYLNLNNLRGEQMVAIRKVNMNGMHTDLKNKIRLETMFKNIFRNFSS